MSKCIHGFRRFFQPGYNGGTHGTMLRFRVVLENRESAEETVAVTLCEERREGEKEEGVSRCMCLVSVLSSK